MSVKDEIERNLGPQPLAEILKARKLTAHALVAASTEHITHKMVARACRGRRLTPKVQEKIRRALINASGDPFERSDLFTY